MSDRRQLTAWAGMIAPALFVGVLTLEGRLRPGYDPLLGIYDRIRLPVIS